MKIFVSGGLGVIGSLFTKQMILNNHSVTVLDSCEEPRNELIAKDLEAIGVNIRKERMETADLSEIENYDLILHAAAFTGIPCSAEKPDDDWLSNVETTRNLLSTLMKINKPPATVVLSSVKPYKINNKPIHEEDDRYTWSFGDYVTEDCPLSPDEPYAASKMAQSAICTAYAKTYNLPLIVFRCSNLYGAAPCHGPRHGWLTWFCISAALGKDIIIQGTGKQSRDMLYSSDVTSAVIAAYNNMDKIKGELFNIGGGGINVISVKEAAKKLQEISNISILSAPERKFEDLVFTTNYNKFASKTGWRPQVNVDNGIINIYNWAINHKEELREIYKEYL